MKPSSRQGRKGTFLCLACLLVSACSSARVGRLELDPSGRRFLDICGYIIHSGEEKVFREMPPEDREDFMREFWARRDPDPSTPENEFRQTYMSRFATADRAFSKGKPGWKTDRGMIYILFGPPTNIISKTMGDTPYEQQKFTNANPLETGTLTERPTEIWVYDSYLDHAGGPLRLVFVDFHSTGDYTLQTKEEIRAFSMMSPLTDPPSLAKFQWLGELTMDEKSLRDSNLFDYDVIADIERDGELATVVLTVDIPYLKLDYRSEENLYSLEIRLEAEITDDGRRLLTSQNKALSRTFDEKSLKELFFARSRLTETLTLDLPPGARSIYIRLEDRVRKKSLRKLLRFPEE